MELSPEQASEVARITAEMASVGPCLTGSLVTRLGPCGKARCACHGDPPRLHGPYLSWSRKVSARTVTRLLNAEQAEDYRVLIDNDRRLRALVRQLEALTLGLVEADPRWRRR